MALPATMGDALIADFQPTPRADSPGPLLAIVIPTFNECPNVRPLVAELEKILAGVEWEVIFVDDDSPDGTAEAVRELGHERVRVRCVQRIGRRGLSSACVEGMLASTAPYLAVMDGDMQHDPSILPQMLELLRSTEAEIVIGSRHVEGGSIGEFSRARALLSRLGTRLSSRLIPPDLKDPMSGFLMLRRSLLQGVMRNLSCLGFKILLDIMASASRPVPFREVPYTFRLRNAGDSKLDSQVAWDYLMLLADKSFGRYVPVRFVSFAAIGSLGVVVHLTLLTSIFRLAALNFVVAQALATGLTMIFNYSLNNLLTYRDMRRRGARWVTGLLSFMAACSVGAMANVGVAAYLFRHRSQWLLAAVAGVAVGVVWNYAITNLYTWGRPRKT